MRIDRLQRIVLPLCAVVLALGVVEIGLRIIGRDLNRQPHLRYSQLYGWLLDPEFTEIDRINEGGFRGSGTHRARGEATKRLLVVGDSFSFAGHQPYSLTFSGLLEKWLGADEAAEWEVANLSVPDWGTAQELLALEHVGLTWEPDVVILQLFPYNDLCNNTLEMANTCGALQDHHRPYFVLDESGELRRRFLSPWARRLRVVSRLFGLVEDLWIAARRRGLTNREVAKANLRKADLPDHWGSTYAMIPADDQPPVVRRGWEVTARLLSEFEALSRERDAELIGVTIPYFSTFDPTWVAQQEAAGVPLDPVHDTRKAALLLEEAGISHLSMRDLIEASHLPPSSFFISLENGHLSDLGHALLAQQILDELIRRDLTDVAPPQLDYQIAADFMLEDEPEGFSISGMTPTRRVEDGAWRFGLGPETTIEFGDTRVRSVSLSFSAVGLFPGQEFGIEVNGRPVYHVTELPVQRRALTDTVSFSTTPGRNSITFRYKDWNRRTEAYLPGESRVLAVKFVRLALQETGSGTAPPRAESSQETR